MSTKRFRVAFSFAGEKRDFVEKVAGILAIEFGKEQILYDKYHEAEFARPDLGIYLPKLYGEDSDLIVPVICRAYDEKRWTGWEWMHIYGLITKADRHRVMPSRFDFANVEGLSLASGYVDLDNKSPSEFAALIVERLKINGAIVAPVVGSQPAVNASASTPSLPRTPRTTIPHNLPRPQSFFGREAELKKIAGALAEDGRGWGALIDGPGGIGKTALAIRAAELVPAGRFKRITFLSSKERELTADGQRPLGHFVLPSYLEMLNAVARELGRPELSKSPETERSDEILRALRGADVLLVLDNLETLPESDRDQLFAFLNRLPTGCSAIVTSRRRADASAIAVRLDRLDWEATRSLLEDIAQHNDKLAKTSEVDRRKLHEETGGNPLLMRWIVGQLGRGRCRTIGDALAFLRSAPAGNDPLEFIFGDLLDTFTDSETKCLAALVHFTTLIQVKFIAELAGLNEAAAQGALSDLSARALVLPDEEERTYALVPMAADFLRRKRPDVVKMTADRLESSAYALIVENGYEQYERFEFLEGYWPAVASALPLYIVRDNARLQKVCHALIDFLDFMGRWDEWLLLETQAELKALAVEDHQSAAWRAYYAGHIHHLRRQGTLVLDCARRAQLHWQNAKSGPRERALAVRLRGIGHEINKDYDDAIKAYQEALDLFKGLSAESQDVANALNDLADANRASGDFVAAENFYIEAIEVAYSIGYSAGIATSAGNLARLALHREEWEKAEVLARQALPLAENLKHSELIAADCHYLARALARLGRSSEGLIYAHRAVEIYARLGSPDLADAHDALRECGG